MIKYFNQDKWERAKKSVSDPSDEKLVLEAYKKLGGAFEIDCNECEVKPEVKVETPAPIKRSKKTKK